MGNPRSAAKQAKTDVNWGNTGPFSAVNTLGAGCTGKETCCGRIFVTVQLVTVSPNRRPPASRWRCAVIPLRQRRYENLDGMGERGRSNAWKTRGRFAFRGLRYTAQDARLQSLGSSRFELEVAEKWVKGVIQRSPSAPS